MPHPRQERDGRLDYTSIECKPYNELGTKSPVESDEAFVVEDFPHAIHAVLVQQLTNNGTPLILHTGLKIITFSNRVPGTDMRIGYLHCNSEKMSTEMLCENEKETRTKIDRIHNRRTECASHTCRHISLRKRFGHNAHTAENKVIHRMSDLV